MADQRPQSIEIDRDALPSLSNKCFIDTARPREEGCNAASPECKEQSARRREAVICLQGAAIGADEMSK